MSHLGEKHHSSVLTEADVRAIRSADPKITNRQLGKAFGCSAVSAWKARTGKSWKHLS